MSEPIVQLQQIIPVRQTQQQQKYPTRMDTQDINKDTRMIIAHTLTIKTKERKIRIYIFMKREGKIP